MSREGSRADHVKTRHELQVRQQPIVFCRLALFSPVASEGQSRSAGPDPEMGVALRVDRRPDARKRGRSHAGNDCRTDWSLGSLPQTNARLLLVSVALGVSVYMLFRLRRAA